VPVKLSGFKIDDKPIVQCGRTVKIETVGNANDIDVYNNRTVERITLDLNKNIVKSSCYASKVKGYKEQVCCCTYLEYCHFLTQSVVS